MTRGRDGATGGAAHELPAGRLRSFEDDDAAPDLATLLSKRAPRHPARSDTDGAPAALKPPSTSRRRRTTEPAAAAAQETDSAPSRRRGRTATDKHTEVATTAAAAPSRRAARRQAQTQAPPATEPDAASKPEKQNRIRSSSVHIPAALLDRVIAERQRSNRSNGEIIIVAIEQAHGRLPELIRRRDPTGGGLFAARSSRGARLSDGPLTPLNVRLFEADYQVIDQLVQQFGAYSRGHLISTALAAYFDSPPQ